MTCPCPAHQAAITAALADQRAALRVRFRILGETVAGVALFIVLAIWWTDPAAQIVLMGGCVALSLTLEPRSHAPVRDFAVARADFTRATQAIAGCPTHGPAMRLAPGAQAGA